MQSREEFVQNVIEMISGGILFVDEVMEGTDKITNYSDEVRTNLGDQFATIAGAAGIAKKAAEQCDAPESVVGIYDQFSDIFADQALAAYTVSGKPDTPDEIAEFCRGVGELYSECCHQWQIDPVKLFDSGMGLAEAHRAEKQEAAK